MLTLFLKNFLKEIWGLATPKAITYFWGFGSFLGVMMVVQVLSGILLACYYVSGSLAWDSVVEITREVSGGWVVRLIHMNSASFVFVVMFIHFFRGIIQSSFSLAGPWVSGWLIMLLSMAAAFLGYVLPWGQMSFWGATVIINLISVLPSGPSLVVWLWGGFYVSNFTCSFFYAFHFLVPLIILGLAGVHLALLHYSGSTISGGLSRSNITKMKFSHLFLWKDLVNISLLWSAWLVALFTPDWAADPVNFAPSDMSSSPVHIQPEWYFLHLYAILRSIPNKLGGLLGFFMAIILLLALSWFKFINSLSQLKGWDLMAWSFIWVNSVLVWLGAQAVEEPFISLGQLNASLYFSFIVTVVWLGKIIPNLFK